MIYFVQETGLLRNRIKIGFTDKIKGRMAGLRGSSPSGLKLLMVLPGDTHIEAAYHEKFRKYRLHGEWFKFGFRLRWFVWINQSKPFILPESEIEPELAPHQDASILELDMVQNEPRPKPEQGPNEDEMRVIEAFVSVRDGGKFSWRKATDAAYGRFGKDVNEKMRSVLEKYDIDYYSLVPKVSKPTEEETAIIEAFASICGSGKFSWNNVVKLSFGDDKTGIFYHSKVKKTLDKFNIDYSEFDKKGDEVRSLK